MKIFRVTIAYDQYSSAFYQKNPHLTSAPYKEQKSAFDFDCFLWADFWERGFKKIGVTYKDSLYNVPAQQLQWAKEHHVTSDNLDDILIAQINHFSPDIVWFDYNSEPLFNRIKKECKSAKLIFGTTGSAINHQTPWQKMDFVTSCAPEAVATIKSKGVPAIHIDHAFDPVVLERLGKKVFQKKIDVSFVGQIVRKNQYHILREETLIKLAEETPLSIFSPNVPSVNLNSYSKFMLKLVLHKLGNFMPKSGQDLLPNLIKAQINNPPKLPIHPKLRAICKPGLFGLDMYQMLAESRIVLNIHADSSPKYASNMRLFEVTGIGSCLLTDYRSNINALFVPDEEIVVYKSPAEAVDKIKWLLENPTEREAIAKRGQKKTFEIHTFEKRAERLHHEILARLENKSTR